MSTSRVVAFLLTGFFLLSLSSVIRGQQSSPATMDAQSAALVAKALSALNGTTAVSDVTLTGTIRRTAGPDDESGTITLRALGTGLSRIDMNLSGGTWSELRGLDSKSLPKSTWSGPDGTVHVTAGHNMLTDAVWFFPSLSSLSKNSARNQTLTISYIGQEARKGLSVQHIHFITQFPPHPAVPSGQKTPPGGPFSVASLTAMEMYLDASSDLPTALTFNTHPDNNALVNIPVEIDFGNYQRVNGVLVPTHIQKFLNGTPLLDITVQSTTINTGLSTAEFAAQ